MEMNLVDPKLELTDPNPDVQKLFTLYDDLFFGGILKNRTKVEWSSELGV